MVACDLQNPYSCKSWYDAFDIFTSSKRSRFRAFVEQILYRIVQVQINYVVFSQSKAFSWITSCFGTVPFFFIFPHWRPHFHGTKGAFTLPFIAGRFRKSQREVKRSAPLVFVNLLQGKGHFK